MGSHIFFFCRDRYGDREGGGGGTKFWLNIAFQPHEKAWAGIDISYQIFHIWAQQLSSPMPKLPSLLLFHYPVTTRPIGGPRSMGLACVKECKIDCLKALG